MSKILKLTDNGDFHFGGIGSILVYSRNLINATVLSFRFVVEKLAVVRDVLYPAERRLLDTLVVDYPSDVRRWFSDYLHIEVESLVLAYRDITQILPIDLWRHCRKKMESR